MDILFTVKYDYNPLFFADMLRKMAGIDRILFAVWHCPSFQPPGFQYDNVAEAITYNRISAVLANIANIHMNSSMKAASLWGAVSCYVHALWRGLRGNRVTASFLFRLQCLDSQNVAAIL